MDRLFGEQIYSEKTQDEKLKLKFKAKVFHKNVGFQNLALNELVLKQKLTFMHL